MAKLKILIADDRKTDQALYDKSLPDDVYEKKFADDGEETVDKYQSWQPDIILLDLMMPVKSGFSVLQDIRNSEKKSNKKSAIIVITQLSKKEDIEDCAKLGIQGYFIKPIKTADMNKKILNCYQKFLGQSEN